MSVTSTSTVTSMRSSRSLRLLPSSLSAQRTAALIRKETRQLLRDRSSILVGGLLPLILILIFGYGLSFDVKNLPVAIVMDEVSPTATDAAAGFYLSPYFSPVIATSMREAEEMMQT